MLARLCSDGPLNRVRKRLGLAPQQDNFLERIYDGSVTLGLWSPHYRAPAGDDPPQLEICGFPWFESDFVEGERKDLLRFLDGGEPPIVAVLGTGQFRVAGDFFQVVAKACERLGQRGLFLTGSEEPVALDLPPSVRCFARAPFSLVLERASAVVHHGGIGTVAQVMRAGCPSVIVPFAHDQHDNALRMERLRLGKKIARRRLSEKTLTAALERLLHDPEVQNRCRAMKDRLRPEDGAAKAAQILEEIAMTRRQRR
jgi:UDP:flavonoid glycosyltransferase YjiC (YdhE family)